MKCSKCNAEIPDSSKFCPQCAAPQTVPSNSPEPRAKAPGWAVALVVLCLAMGGYILYQATNGATAGKPNSGYQTPASTLISQPQPRFVPVTNGALTVNASAYSWYQFTVPQGATGVNLNGHFTASGGMGNDIIVYVLDEDGFANFKNGHPARTYFNSEKITQASIGAVLPNDPATYYLVFDNRFSLITPKAVQVTATLNYMQ
jgi:hypothetical protein